MSSEHPSTSSPPFAPKADKRVQHGRFRALYSEEVLKHVLDSKNSLSASQWFYLDTLTEWVLAEFLRSTFFKVQKTPAVAANVILVED